MRELLQQLESDLDNRRPVAVTTLVETRGSTPQKAGATMLVYADGSQSGTLGGGCVEADVKRRALQLLETGQREILTFQLDSDYGWDDGLICGGRMRMLVDPICFDEGSGFDKDSNSVDAYFRTLIEHLGQDRAATEIIVFDNDEQLGATPGDRYLIDAQQNIIAQRLNSAANVDDQLLEQLLANYRPIEQRPRPYVVSGCAYLTYLKRCRLIIVGGGHVGQKVGELANAADFDIWVVDDRDQYCNAERFPYAQRLLVSEIEATVSELNVDENTFCLVVTRGHRNDEEALYHLSTTPARYVGMIGSRRKIRLIFEDLISEGIPLDDLRRVRAPLGFEIGSQTVPEIAISIVAELIACRNLDEIPAQYQRPSLIDENAV